MNAEERQLQITLAQLQTNIQTYLTITIAFFALGGAFLVGELQSMSAPKTTTNIIMMVLLFCGMIVFLLLGAFSLKRYNQFHSKLNALV
jgi:hypothetical protein